MNFFFPFDGRSFLADDIKNIGQARNRLCKLQKKHAKIIEFRVKVFSFLVWWLFVFLQDGDLRD
jgi:hypothetical protein